MAKPHILTRGLNKIQIVTSTVMSALRSARTGLTNSHITLDLRILTRRVWSSIYPSKSIHQTPESLRGNEIIRKGFHRAGSELTLQVFDNLRILLPSDNGAEDIIVNDAREVFVEKIYEYQDVRLKPSDVVLDCGANVGLFSVFAAPRISNLNGDPGQLVTLEPIGDLIYYAKRNVDESAKQFGGLVSIPVQAAVSNVTGASMIYIDEACFTMNSMAERFANREGLERKAAIEIACYRIDDLVHKLKLPRVDFIKMDIEGFEVQALSGAERTLRTWRPRLAIAAYHFQEDLHALPELILKFNPDYRIHLARELGPMLYAW